MKKYLIQLTGLMFLLPLAPRRTAAQESHRFTLQQCIDYAVQHQPSVKTARIDELSALALNKEVTGRAYPQISASGSFQDNIVVQKTLIDGSYFDPNVPKGTLVPIAFGTPYNLGGTINATQTIFDGSIMVALQARRTLEQLARLSVVSAERDVKVSVSKAYYGILLSDKQLQLISDNIGRLEKLLNDTRIMYKTGVAEKLDVDRLTVQLNNLQSQLTQSRNGRTLTEQLLKYQMGMPLADSVALADTLSFTGVRQELLTDSHFSYNDLVDYQLLNTQKKANEYNLKRYRLAYAPTLSAFGTLGASRQSYKFDYFNQHQFWYGYGLVGLSLNIPIFDGLQKKYQVDQAMLAVQKTQAQIEGLKQSIDLAQRQSTTSLVNNILTVESQEKNMKLAEEVYNTTVKKYEQGVGSSTEINNAEGDLQTSQLNYYNALYNTIIAKIDYDKAYGKLK